MKISPGSPSLNQINYSIYSEQSHLEYLIGKNALISKECVCLSRDRRMELQKRSKKISVLD